MLPAAIAIDCEAVAALCRDYGVARLSLFGSALRSDFDPQRSDVDLLVEFRPGEHKSLFKLLKLQAALAAVIGRQVDLTTPGSLSRYFRTDVLATAQVLYDAA
jgi:predicted nucleotidyltransferase